MKNVLFVSLLVSMAITQQTTSYSWEDGTGTILGTYCYGSCDGVDDAENVGSAINETILLILVLQIIRHMNFQLVLYIQMV